MTAALSFLLCLACRRQSCLHLSFLSQEVFCSLVGSYNTPHRAGPGCQSSEPSLGKSAGALALGDRKRRDAGWSCHSSKGNLDHLLNNAKRKERDLFLSLGGHSLQRVQQKHRGQHTSELLSAPGSTSCYTSENTLWAAKGGAILGRRHLCTFVWSPAVTEYIL